MNSAENLALLGRVMGGLLVVLVLIGLAARVARRARGTTGTSGLRVVDRVGLSRDANLAVVEVGDRLLLLGVTAQGVTMLADLDQLPDRGPVREAAVPAQTPPRMPEMRTPPDGEEPTTDDEPASRRPLPTGIALDQYPDLASALRAAGRTTDPAGPAGAGGSQMVVSSGLAIAGPAASSSARPQTRAQVRAQARAASREQAGLAPAKASGRSRIPLPRKSAPPTGNRLAVPEPPGQASGSVLSPKTWRQGLEALRDLTVRRG